jgi:hypothetical protein
LIAVTDKDCDRISTDEAIDIRRAVNKLVQILSAQSERPFIKK